MMRRLAIRRLLLPALAALAAAAQMGAGPPTRHEQRVRAMPAPVRKSLAALKTLRRDSLEELSLAMSAAAVEKATREILAMGSLCVGSRAMDANGRAPVHSYIQRHVDALRGAGVICLGSLRGEAAVPVSLDRLLKEKDRGSAARVTVGERSWPMTPLWPNGAMPSLCPKGGLKGPLVSVGAGDWGDLKGLDLANAICLMRFEGGINLQRLYSLGCQAVIVVEDDYVMRGKAEELACSTPLPLPRFYVDANTGSQLAALATRQQFAADGARQIVQGKSCLLEGGNIYENRRFESLFAYLPPTAPLKYEVGAEDLLERIAQDNGVSIEDLKAENKLAGGLLKPGMELAIPRKSAAYTVKPGDLMDRLTAEFGLEKGKLAAANKLKGSELAAGQVLTIPNLEDTMVILVQIDSVSVAPDSPHGAKTACNLAAALAAMEHLATSTSSPRRKGVLFGFLDAEAVGGMTSRTFAEYVLQNRGDLKAVGVIEQTFSAGAVVAGVILGLLAGATAGFLRVRARPGGARAKLLPTGLMALIVGGAGFAITFFPQRLSGYEEDASRATPERYQASLTYLGEPGKAQAAGDKAAARWLCEKWLLPRVEDRRVASAEEQSRLKGIRPDVRRKLAEARKQGGQDQRIAELRRQDEQLGGQLDELAKRIKFVASLRDGSIKNEAMSWPRRVEEFCCRLGEAEKSGQAGEVGLSLAALRERMRTEMEQERTRREFRENNLAVARAVLLRVDPLQADKKEGDSGRSDFRPSFGYLLDLSAGSQITGLKATTGFRGITAPGSARGSAASLGYETNFARAVAYAGVNAGWTEDWLFWTEADQVDYPVMQVDQPAVYTEFWTAAGIIANVFGTLNDPQELLDTPHDVPERMDFGRVSTQARTALMAMKLGLESHTYSQPPVKIENIPKYGKLVGQALQFNIRSGIDAQDPVAGVYVCYGGFTAKLGDAGGRNTLSYCGGRRGLVQISLLNGSYEMPLMWAGYKGKMAIHGYRLNRETALFDKAVDNGQVGTQKKTPDFKLIDKQTAKKNLIMARDLYPLVFYPGPDPVDYKAIGGADTFQTVKVVDAATQGEPQHYAYVHPANDYHEEPVEGHMVFLPPGRSVRLMAQQNITYKMLLVGPVTEDEARGVGFRVGPVDGQRNLSLPMTPLRIARDMHSLGSRRQEVYQNYGITDKSIGESLARSAEKIAASEKAVADRDWQAAIGSAREAWGILIKFYPRILKLGREAVFSAVILMALLVPGAAFLEKLLLGGKTILRHLLGTTVIFVLGVVFLNFFHPAFRISVSPFIVMIAFTMILMALIVLTISYQRFDVLVRRARAAGGEVEGEEISLGSSLATALSLGVSNLKKRPVRTALTCFTVTVLTFSIITFVSVRGKDAVDRKEIAIDPTVETETVDPLPPAYEGVLFRSPGWKALPEVFVSSLYTEFGSTHELATRGHYLQTEGGNNADREGMNQIKVTFGRKEAILGGVMTYEPQEPRFSGLDRAVSHRQWFRARDNAAHRDADRHATILPDGAARQLGICEGMLYDLRLRPEHVADWSALCRAIAEPNSPPAARLAERLGDGARQTARAGAAGKLDPARGQALLDAINSLLPGADLFDANTLAGAAGVTYREAGEDGLTVSRTGPRKLRADLKADDYAWLNGLVVERVLGAGLEAGRDVLRAQDKLPVVVFMNIRWKVVGVLDTAHADRVRDITGKPMGVLDYLRSGISPNATITDLVNEPTTYYLSWRRLLMIPQAAAADVKAKPRSVAIRFQPGEDTKRFFDNVALRLNMTICSNTDGKLSLVTTVEKQSVAGLAKIIVPVILCILIVWNTMMANVEERRGEVAMLGAVGLSPRQISFLLLSESAVFSVLGIVLGIFAGLLFSNGVAWANAHWYTPAATAAGQGFLSELSFNFTSLWSLVLAMGTGLVVLLATLIPAKKAAALAAPSGMERWQLPAPAGEGFIQFNLPFTLTRGNAVGMAAFFRRFLLNHSDAASADFNCRGIRAAVRDDGEPSLALTAQMWLAPYDLDVAQALEVKVLPTENAGVFGVLLNLHRTSGTEEAWLRTNYNFMDLVRHQFLLWRNLDTASRERYIAEGAAVFQAACQEAGN
jgi:LysM repeat protein